MEALARDSATFRASPMTRNVTINPTSGAIPVENPAITEVLDLATGDIVATRKFIASQRYDELVSQRGLN